MSRTIKIAFRNILRNRRRSAMTGSAVAAGALAMLLFGAFASQIFSGLETNTVQRIGHLTVFKKGFFVFGAGNPAAYGIDDYKGVMATVAADPVLLPLVAVMTPTQSLVGIAGNFNGETDASKTFFGVGLVPSDRERMRQWNPYGVGAPYVPDTRLADGEEARGIIGAGLARILGLCEPLKLPHCVVPPKQRTAGEAAAPADVLALAKSEVGGTGESGPPRLQLLAATANGAPNVVELEVSGAEPQGVKELDDNYVAMNLGLAQQLVYGRGEHKATGIVLQLRRTQDLGAARARLENLIGAKHLDLEVRDYNELTPFNGQVRALFASIFLFIALIMGVIVLFAVVNTMTMNVMERTNEIGTIRALGLRRGGVRSQFVTEGLMIGAIGATAGVAIAIAVALFVNHAGLTWTPPGNANSVPLKLDLFGRRVLVPAAWLGLVLVATLAALLPANRAAKLPVVDALRHV
jgi:putative ABC transport system permease protein